MFDDKIFVLGFNKTATASIHQFLLQNGISSAHWLDRRNNLKKNLALEMANNVENGRPILTGIDGLVAYSDLSYVGTERLIEANEFYRELHAEYPNAIFILNTRPLDDWLLSRLRHKDLTERYLKATHLDLRALLDSWSELRQHREKEIRDYFAGNPNFCFFDISNGFEPMFEIMKRREVPIKVWEMPHKHLGITKQEVIASNRRKERILEKSTNPTLRRKLKRRIRRLKRLVRR